MSRQSTARDTSVMRTEMNPYIVDVPTGIFGWGKKPEAQKLDVNGVPVTPISKKLEALTQKAIAENDKIKETAKKKMDDVGKLFEASKKKFANLSNRAAALNAVAYHGEQHTQASKTDGKNSSQNDSNTNDDGSDDE